MITLTKEILELEYIKNKKGSRIIAKEYNSTPYFVLKALKEYNIPIASPERRQDLVGLKFNRLLVIKMGGFYYPPKYKGISTTKQLLWLCKCDCGNETLVRATNLKSNTTKSCGCLHTEVIRSGYNEISGEYWTRVKNGSKRRSRNVDFNISIEYAWDLFLKQDRKCALSGIDIYFKFSNYISKTNDRQTASLDRIDSSKGYIEGNVQWVHKDINNMKQALTQQEFINWCKLVTINSKIGK